MIDVRDYWDGVSAFYAGSANVALQMLGAPGVAYGVMESKVEGGRVDAHPFKRGRTTMTYLAVAAFGTDEDRAAYREAVNGVHRQVRSTDDSPVGVQRVRPRPPAVGGRLPLLRLGRHLRAPARAARRGRPPRPSTSSSRPWVRRSRCPARCGPRTGRPFDAYFQQRIADADIDEPTADYVRMLIGFHMTPWWFRPAGFLLTFMNTGYTPPALRAKLGLRWSRRHQLVFDRVNRVTGAVVAPAAEDDAADAAQPLPAGHAAPGARRPPARVTRSATRFH